jgi:hypothetical protein
LPTAKNAPASEFYSTQGFRLIQQNDAGFLWEIGLTDKQITSPKWINLVRGK